MNYSTMRDLEMSGQKRPYKKEPIDGHICRGGYIRKYAGGLCSMCRLGSYIDVVMTEEDIDRANGEWKPPPLLQWSNRAASVFMLERAPALAL
jgi:hypothetical protein